MPTPSITTPSSVVSRRDITSATTTPVEGATATQAEPVATAVVDDRSVADRSVDIAARDAARQAHAAGSVAVQQLQASTTAPTTSGPRLPDGYGSLERLAGRLHALDDRFSPDTPQGRSALAMALAIGGTEVYGRNTTGTDFFTRRGGTGRNMLGFAQFNLAYHRQSTSTPEKYTRFVGDILTGTRRMPNSAPASDHVSALTDAVQAGRIQTGADLRAFMDRRGFGGSNWQGIDDGWSRNPGLADALVQFLRDGASQPRT
jgi:hypothetical protein